MDKMPLKFRAWDKATKSFIFWDMKTQRMDFEPAWSDAIDVFTGHNDKYGHELYSGDILKVNTLYTFDSELADEWKEMHDLKSINDVGMSFFTGILVADIRRGLMFKRLDNDFAVPVFTRSQYMTSRFTWCQSERVGTIHSHNPLDFLK